LENPPVAWLPSRSRKLLPRLSTALPDEMSALIMVGVGVGVSVGDGDGLGVGVGVGVGVSVGLGDGDCALAGDKAAIVTTRTKPSATARATTRPTPVAFAREGRDEQHMDAIPNSSAN
jgi:hypothetical protein